LYTRHEKGRVENNQKLQLPQSHQHTNDRAISTQSHLVVIAQQPIQEV
jgi:hypothetical protein